MGRSWVVVQIDVPASHCKNQSEIFKINVVFIEWNNLII